MYVVIALEGRERPRTITKSCETYLLGDVVEMQVAFDVVMAAGGAGIWQRIVRPALQDSAVEALRLLCSGANSLPTADARQLRGVLGPLPNRPAAQRAPQAAGAGTVTHAVCISGVCSP